MISSKPHTENFDLTNSSFYGSRSNKLYDVKSWDHELLARGELEHDDGDNENTRLSGDSFDAVSFESEEYKQDPKSAQKCINIYAQNDQAHTITDKFTGPALKKRPETSSSGANTNANTDTNQRQLPKKKKNRKAIYEKKFQYLSLLKSEFPNRPATFYFFYPKEITAIYTRKGMFSGGVLPVSEEPDDNLIGVKLRHKETDQIIVPDFKKFMKQYSMPIGKIGPVYLGLRNILKENGFTLTKSSNFNICWGFCSQKEHIRRLEKLQKFSHFPGCWQVGRKDNLWLNLQGKGKIMPEFYNFLPKTYCLKNEYDAWIKDKDSVPYWILKPVDSARGEGIRLITKDERTNSKALKGFLASQYIANVHLINGYKYDMRIYACVTCLDP
jgi:hypothetical protein